MPADTPDGIRTPDTPLDEVTLDEFLSRIPPQQICEIRVDPHDCETVAIPYASPGMLSAFGLQPADASGRYRVDQLCDALHPDDRQRICALLLDGHQRTVVSRGRCRLVLPEAGERWTTLHAEPRQDTDGTIVWRLVITDVTEVLGLVKQLRAVYDRLRLATETSQVGVWEADITSGTYLYDEQMHEIYGIGATGFRAGVPPNTFAGSGHDEWLQVIHPDDRGMVMDALQRAVAAPSSVEYEHRIFRPSGDMRYVRSVARVIHDEAGTPLRAVGTTMDVSDQKRLTETLAKEQERLQLATRAGRVGIWEIDLTSGMYIYNDEMYEIYGIDGVTGFRAGVLPNTWGGYRMDEWLKILHPDDVASVFEAWQRAEASQEIVEFEHRIFRSSGEMRYVRSASLVFRNADGVAVRGVGTTMDVTDQKRLNDALAKEKERLVLATRAGRIGVWEMQFADHRFTWDDQMYDLYGLPPGSFSGRLDDWIPLIHADDVERVLEEWRAALEETSVLDTMFRVRHASGRVIYMRATARVVRVNDVAVRAYGINWDVTPEQTLTEALRLEKDRLALATRVSGVGIWDLDVTTGLVRWDERLDEIFADSAPHFRSGVPANTYGGTFEEYLATVHPDDRAIILASIESANAGADSIDVQFRICGAGETSRYLRGFAKVVRDADGRIVQLVGTNTDITNEREATDALRVAKEAAERAEQVKGEFLAVMSHEIRTPMNSVLGMARLALQTELSPRQRNYLSKIDASARSLVTILDDILDFSKIEAGKMAVEETPFTVESLLESVASVTAMKAEERGLEIAFAVAAGVPSKLVGDPLRVGQVLINLVNNSIKFTEQGEVVVSIELERLDGPRAILRIAVRDTGIGLREDQIANLFTAFTQAERHISRKFGGTGLGLAISRRLVELMGGRIWAEGAPGRGSTFTFTIDVGVGSDVIRPARRDAVAGLAGRHVLIVDDNASAREILMLMVQGFGMRSTAVASGTAALETLRAASTTGAPYELVLMDWRMPGLDGLETARAIKSDPNLHGTPAVLMVTAYGREEILKRAQQLGLEGVLIKPITESIMFNTIADVLGCAYLGPDTAAVQAGLPARLAMSEAQMTTLVGKRVLVVDDNALNREVATEWLIAAGMQVDGAVHGRDALARLDVHDYDVVLMDVHMPEMDGLTAAREIRRRPRLAALPIVALTAQAQAIDRDASFDAGMNAHLTKPIDEGRLYETIAQLLAKSAVRPAALPGPPQAAPVADEDVVLPASLPGIDLGAALELLGDRRGMLLRLLRTFARDFAEGPSQLMEAQAAGRAEDVGRLAHTLKSAAAYVGARSLSQASARLEEAVRSGDDWAGLMRLVHQRLDTVLRGLAEADTAASAPPVAPAPGTPPARPPRSPHRSSYRYVIVPNAVAVLEAIAQAEPLVARGDYAAAARLGEISHILSTTPLAATAEQIRLQFEELELEAAVDGLQQLRSVILPEARS